MTQELRKQAALIIIVLAAGAILKSIDFIADVEVWRWRLGTLVHLVMFTAAALVASLMADRVSAPVLGSSQLARLIQLTLLALATYMLFVGVRRVVTPSLVTTIERSVAVLMVLFVGYSVWVVYAGFDGILEVLRRLKAVTSTAPSPSAPPAPPAGRCAACGSLLSPEQRFCGACGAPRA